MGFLSKHSGLYTDMYELTMGQSYFLEGRSDSKVCFDYFFRNAPNGGGYVLFAGLQDLLKIIEGISFDEEDIRFLKSYHFDEKFLDYLSGFSFKGSIWSVKEGEVVFPIEPALRVEGNIIEAQIIETLLLNLINFESLIATKASRIRRVAGDRILSEFGLRRAQGLGGIHASRASIIGGFDSTSNVYAAYHFDIKAAGTMAHSYVQSHEDELTAFRDFSKNHPDNSILLVDTYNTLKSGIPNAIIVAKEMEAAGHRLQGIRLDSGDLAYMARESRKMLNEAGLDYVKIVASNQLDEHVIRSLMIQEAPIDMFGVGTSLAVGKPDAALDGVYKLTEMDGIPRLKISDNLKKTSLPGKKQVLRYTDEQGQFFVDAIILEEESRIKEMFHPHERERSIKVEGKESAPLLQKVMENGKTIIADQHPLQIAAYAKERLTKLPEEFKRFEFPHVYKVGISKSLMDLQMTLIKKHKEKYYHE